MSAPKRSSEKSSQAAPPLNRNEAIRRRAEEIYIQNGRLPGRDLENWAKAEQEIDWELALSSAPASTAASIVPTATGIMPDVRSDVAGAIPAKRRAIVMRIKGKEYVGEYDLASADGYRPGEFTAGIPVPIHLNGNQMLVVRPNGKVLRTTIV